MSVIKSAIKTAVPASVVLWATRQTYRRYCPLCKQGHYQFKPFGDPIRQEALCPSCGCLERHRLVRLYFERETNLFDGHKKKLLHIAPEGCVTDLFKSTPGIEYMSGDLDPRNAMRQIDITQIDFQNDSFDIIYCSHVLEHVIDDQRAMREFCRVLRPGGWAILQVPITAAKTFEDSSVTDPQERLRLFGQVDHVRRYGPDYADRLRTSGFDVHVSRSVDLFGQRLVLKFGLDPEESVHFCRKPAMR